MRTHRSARCSRASEDRSEKARGKLDSLVDVLADLLLVDVALRHEAVQLVLEKVDLGGLGQDPAGLDVVKVVRARAHEHRQLVGGHELLLVAVEAARDHERRVKVRAAAQAGIGLAAGLQVEHPAAPAEADHADGVELVGRQRVLVHKVEVLRDVLRRVALQELELGRRVHDLHGGRVAVEQVGAHHRAAAGLGQRVADPDVAPDVHAEDVVHEQDGLAAAGRPMDLVEAQILAAAGVGRRRECAAGRVLRGRRQRAARGRAAPHRASFARHARRTPANRPIANGRQRDLRLAADAGMPGAVLPQNRRTECRAVCGVVRGTAGSRAAPSGAARSAGGHRRGSATRPPAA
mmetsp:Transcript_6766/g.17297  ORF Transcript_6766/g.17297 Transcript_6766/m.17297 type:complete len:349 (+) Transcript_6766:297-1343(+)